MSVAKESQRESQRERARERTRDMYGLKHNLVERSGDVTDAGRDNVDEQGKIGLLSQWSVSQLYLQQTVVLHIM